VACKGCGKNPKSVKLFFIFVVPMNDETILNNCTFTSKMKGLDAAKKIRTDPAFVLLRLQVIMGHIE